MTFADTNGDDQVSYAEAAAVTQETFAGITIFRDQVEMQSFNELQYFTGLTEIGYKAFAGCVNLQEITLPSTITTIGDYAFGTSTNSSGQPVPCSSLTQIVIPEGVTTIGHHAFYSSGLQSIYLPASVTTIGDLAFGNCNNLVSIYLPATVTSISGNAFTGNNIESIVVDSQNVTYSSPSGSNAIIQTSTNTLVTGCKSTVIPEGVTAIGTSAFENATGLTEINLPASLTTIEDYAFLNCTGLTTINAESTTPPTLGTSAFGNLTLANITLNVPCDGRTAYAQHEVWGQFDIHNDCEYRYVTAGLWSNAENWLGGELPGENDEAYIDVNCELDQDATVESLTIENGNTLTVQSGKTLNVTGILTNAAAGDLVIADGGQLVANNAVLGTAQKHIVAFTSNDDGWNFIASPVTTPLTAANVSGLIPSGNTTYDFYYLEEETTVWRNYKPNNAHSGFGIEQNIGYLYANGAGTTINFSGPAALCRGRCCRQFGQGRRWLEPRGQPVHFQCLRRQILLRHQWQER